MVAGEDDSIIVQYHGGMEGSSCSTPDLISFKGELRAMHELGIGVYDLVFQYDSEQITD